MSASRGLIVGIGSDYGDDQFGLAVAEWLSARWRRRGEDGSPQIVSLRTPADLLSLLTTSQGAWNCLHLIDACLGAGQAGSLIHQRWPCPAAIFPRVESPNSHNLGLWESLETADRLGALPPSVTLWGVEMSPGRDGQEYFRAPLSAPVQQAIAPLGQLLERELSGQACCEEHFHA